jgi:hypothetical protein
MKNLTRTFVAAVVAFAATASLCAEDTAPVTPAKSPPPKAAKARVSPHDTVSAVVDGNKVTIVYGRPYTKDPKTGEIRTVWGGKLVPSGKIWRTGANEATLLTTEQPITLGGATIPAGTYSLWTWMNDDGKSAKLVVNKQTGQWGANRDLKKVYDEANDVARVDLKSAPLAQTIDQFTMAVEKNPAGNGGLIKLMWADTEYSVPFTVKK